MIEATKTFEKTTRTYQLSIDEFKKHFCITGEIIQIGANELSKLVLVETQDITEERT